MENKRKTSAQVRQDTRQYTREWYNMMVRIWKDRIDLTRAYDTGALRSSVLQGNLNISPNLSRTDIAFTFLHYGIYVDLGVGNGYRHGNGGNLPFLDPVYRHEHNKGKPRERKKWFNTSWYISVKVLKEKLGELLGDEFSGMFDNLTRRERG